MHLKIVSEACPEIRIGDTTYGSYAKEESVDVPFNVGLFLLCKEVADLVPK